ncbi:TonB-dependent receptor [Sphingoaurantiacus capsulatus]|uniref:TonB-dependent receptor n=1 Tax=Sphingoaurantiacus capsulatus TaxID=1771310 RepID=A0ABV7XDM1_9SPHN
MRNRPTSIVHPAKLTLLLGTASLLAMGSAAQAQDSAAAEPAPGTLDADAEEIIVTGFRASLGASLAEKRLSTSIVDVIKAEDIADFPDNNLAESLQRIPGVAITRDQGEGRQITVRGLGPVFTRVRINGMEGLSTTGGADASGGANRGRSFDFNVFASELFNSITVRKTASANVEEGSLGATVDLQTARPFDYREDMTIAGSVQGGYNDLSGKIDPKLAGVFSTKSADNTIGILLSASYSERNTTEEGPSTVRWERGTDNGGFATTSTLPTGATQGYAFFHPRIPRYDSYKYDNKRLGLTASLQWAPQDSTLLTFDTLYADFKSQRAEQYLEAISFSRSGTGKPQTVILPGAQVDATNSLVSGTFNGVDVRVESRFDKLRTKFQQYTANLEQELGERLRLDLIGGYSKSAFANPIQTTVALDANNVNGFAYNFTNGRNPTITYGNLDVTNPASFILGEIRLRPQYVDNTFKTGRAELEFDATETLKIRGGADYKKYSFDSEEYRRASETDVAGLVPAGGLGPLSSQYSIDSGTSINGSPRTFVIPNLQAFADNLGIYSNTGRFALTGIPNASARGNFVTVDERSTAGFLQAALDSEVGGMRLRADAGLRYVETKQTSTGYQNGGPAPGYTLVEVERTYDNWLPSANLSLDVSEDVVLRAAVAKVIARPNLGTVNPGGSFSISGGNRTLTLGNPFISPTKATDVDFSFEWYFAKNAAVVVGLFYKDISSFVATSVQSIPFNQLGLPDSLLVGTTVQPTDLFTVTQPVDSDGGELKGLELGFQAPFTFLGSFGENMGIQANYTYVKSEIEYPLATSAGAPVVIHPLVNLSKHSANATLYYEDEVFSLRGSLAYRSGFLTTVPGRNGVAPGAGPVFNTNAGQPTFNNVEGTHGSLNVDMSASFKLTDNITLTAEAINLTDEYTDQYIDSAADRLSVYHHTGRQFYVGARFKF